jgi:hypothetical protein
MSFTSRNKYFKVNLVLMIAIKKSKQTKNPKPKQGRSTYLKCSEHPPNTPRLTEDVYVRSGSDKKGR